MVFDECKQGLLMLMVSTMSTFTQNVTRRRKKVNSVNSSFRRPIKMGESKRLHTEIYRTTVSNVYNCSMNRFVMPDEHFGL